MDQAELAAGLDDAVEDVGRELGRDIELPAQLADIGDPARPDAGIADLQLARGAEREGGVGQILARQPLQQRARARPHQAQHRQARGDVDHGAAGLGGDVLAAARRGRGSGRRHR